MLALVGDKLAHLFSTLFKMLPSNKVAITGASYSLFASLDSQVRIICLGNLARLSRVGALQGDGCIKTLYTPEGGPVHIYRTNTSRQ